MEKKSGGGWKEPVIPGLPAPLCEGCQAPPPHAVSQWRLGDIRLYTAGLYLAQP